MVPTSAITIDWAGEGKIGTEVKGVPNEGVLYKFNPLRVTSMDGFQLDVNVRMVIRVKPENAAFIIARFGSVDNLIDQIVHPLIDSSFRKRVTKGDRFLPKQNYITGRSIGACSVRIRGI